MAGYIADADGNPWTIREFRILVEKTRQRVVAKEPFIAVRAFEARMHVCHTMNGLPNETAATDGTDVFINPDWFGEHTIDEQVFILAHELFHGACGHCLRLGSRREDIWRQACDHEVNLELKKHGYKMPGSGLADSRFEGWHAERIYEYLLKEQDDTEDCGEDGSGEDTVLSTSATSAECGRILAPLNKDGSKMTKDEIHNAIQELNNKNAVAKMCEISSGDAKIANESILLERLEKRESTWRQELRRLFKKRGTPEGSTWRRLKRRALANKLYMPATRHHGIDWAVFAYDLSSSMDELALTCLNTEMEEIRKTCNIKRITILPFNSSIITSQIKELKKNEKIPEGWVVGGGTNFACIFNWVRRQKGTPDIIMVFTDLGDRNYGDAVKGVETIWASSERVYNWNSGEFTNRPPFGRVVEIDPSVR